MDLYTVNLTSIDQLNPVDRQLKVAPKRNGSPLLAGDFLPGTA